MSNLSIEGDCGEIEDKLEESLSGRNDMLGESEYIDNEINNLDHESEANEKDKHNNEVEKENRIELSKCNDTQIKNNSEERGNYRNIRSIEEEIARIVGEDISENSSNEIEPDKINNENFGKKHEYSNSDSKGESETTKDINSYESDDSLKIIENNANINENHGNKIEHEKVNTSNMKEISEKDQNINKIEHENINSSSVIEINQTNQDEYLKESECLNNEVSETTSSLNEGEHDNIVEHENINDRIDNEGNENKKFKRCIENAPEESRDDASYKENFRPIGICEVDMDVGMEHENSVDRVEIDEFDLNSEDKIEQKIAVKKELEDSDCDHWERSISDSESCNFEDGSSVIEDSNSMASSSNEIENLVWLDDDEDDDGTSQQNSSNHMQNKDNIVNSESSQQYDISNLMDVKKVKNLHRCSICQYTTQNMGFLRKHILAIHNSRKTRKCKYCCKEFPAKHLLEKHVRREHSKKLRKCPYCHYKLLCTGKVMQQHITNMHSSMELKVAKDTSRLEGFKRNGTRGLYICGQCSYSNRSLEIIQSHMKMHHLKYVLQCIHCHYLINDTNQYQSHLKNTHKLAKKVHVCSKCFFQSENYEEYIEHANRPHEFHLCSTCCFKTPFIQIYYAHLETHDGRKQIICSKCNYVAASDENLRYHRLAQHSEKSSDYSENQIKNYPKDDELCLENHNESLSDAFSGGNIRQDQGNAIEIEELQRSDKEISAKKNVPLIPNEKLKDAISGIKNNIISIKEASIVFQIPLEYLDKKLREDKHFFDGEYFKSEGDDTLKWSPLKSHSKTHSEDIVEERFDNSPINRGLSFPKKDDSNRSGENVVEFVQIKKEWFVIEPAPRTQEYGLPPPDEELSFNCNQCDFSTSKFTSMILHENTEHSIDHFECPSCNFEAMNVQDMIVHLKNYIEHTPKLLICPFCTFKIDTNIKMKRHVDTEHVDILQKGLKESALDIGGTALSLESLGDIADSSEQKVDAAYEIGDSSEGKIYKCNLCEYNTSYMESVKSHLKKEHSVKNLKCPRCAHNQSTNFRQFWDHLNQHCPQCLFLSNDPKKLRSHVLTHVPRYNSSNSSRLSKADEHLSSFSKSTRKFQDITLRQMSFDSQERRNSYGSNSGTTKIDSWSDSEENQYRKNSRSKRKLQNELIEEKFTSDESEYYCNEASANNPKGNIRIILENSGLEEKIVTEKSEQKSNKGIRIIVDEACVDNNDSDSKSHSYSKWGDYNEATEEIRLIINESSDDSSRESSKDGTATYNLASSKYIIGRPVKIIKILKHQCFDCLNIYKTRYTLIDHRKKLHGLKKPHSCTYCMENFESYEILKSHYYRTHKVTYHNKDPMFKCPLCDFVSSHLKQTEKHIMRIHRRISKGFKKWTSDN